MLKIEFLYYNKTACKRCASTDKSVKQTLKELKAAVKNSDMKIELLETRLPESKLHLSPSILINGKDMEIILNKGKRPSSNDCIDCCKMTGRHVQCRTFVYKGRKYDYIPKEMILDAIDIISKKEPSIPSTMNSLF